VKTFSQWIQNDPKEKWYLMFDEGRVRHKPLLKTREPFLFLQ
jgi:hypothetical protein